MLERIARALPRDASAAFLCAERDPNNCHRRFIAQALYDRGWRVRHIIDIDETRELTTHQPTLDAFSSLGNE